MEPITIWLIAAYIGGVVVSIVFPYFLAWLEKREPFDWRMNAGRVLVALFGIMPTLASAAFIEQLGAAGYLGAFVLGLGFSQLGRLAQKGGSAALEQISAG